jgi:hypothetical protein
MLHVQCPEQANTKRKSMTVAAGLGKGKNGSDFWEVLECFRAD